MGAVFGTCPPDVCSADSPRYAKLGQSKRGAKNGPKIALQIIYAPVHNYLSLKASPFAQGDEVAVTLLEKISSWQPLGWRQEVSAARRGGQSGKGRSWPSCPRFLEAQQSWGARVVASDGKDGFEEFYCLMQVVDHEFKRGFESAKQAVDDTLVVAAYAQRFNVQAASAVGESVADFPGVNVCASVVCRALGSKVPQIAKSNDYLTLTVYPAHEVRKFVFQGEEEFLELPQAFFHYVAFTSGGSEIVGDLQGYQDDDGIFLVDPVLIRQPKMSIGGLMTVVAGGAETQDSSQDYFNAWHPKCGQLCEHFDPQRRSAVAQKRHCGLAAPTCGVSSPV